MMISRNAAFRGSFLSENLGLVMQSRVGIVVDGYSTGAQVASHLKASRVDLVHIDSSDTVPPEIARSFRGELYSKSLKFNGDLDALCRQLATLAPAFVTPGTESGVELAEAIAGRLGLPGNDPRTIGQNVSSGCIRLTNADIIDLYNRADVGATVIVRR